MIDYHDDNYFGKAIAVKTVLLLLMIVIYLTFVETLLLTNVASNYYDSFAANLSPG